MRKIPPSKSKNDLYKYGEKYFGKYNKLIVVLILIYTFSRLVLFIYTPTKYLLFSLLKVSVLNLLLIDFLLLLLWIILILVFYLIKHIKIERQLAYLKKSYLYIFAMSFIEFLFTILLYLSAFYNLFNLKSNSNVVVSAGIDKSYLPFLIIIGILLLLSFLLFVLFIYKRSLKMLKQYWLILIFLLSVLMIYWFKGPNNYLGLYEIHELRFKFLSLNYGLLGWVILLFFAISFFCNFSSFIIFYLKNELNDIYRFKYIIITFIKTGFVAQCACIGLVIFPELLIWFY